MVWYGIVSWYICSCMGPNRFDEVNKFEICLSDCCIWLPMQMVVLVLLSENGLQNNNMNMNS